MSDNLPAPPMDSHDEAAAFVRDELSEWFYWVCHELEHGRKPNITTLCELATSASVVGEFLVSGKAPEFNEHPRECLTYLMEQAVEIMERGENGTEDYAHLFVKTARRAESRVEGVNARTEAEATYHQPAASIADPVLGEPILARLADEEAFAKQIERICHELAYRFQIIADLAQKGRTPGQEHFDRDIDSLAGQSMNLCHALAASLETDILDETECNEFKTEDQLIEILLRLEEFGSERHGTVAAWLREARAADEEETEES